MIPWGQIESALPTLIPATDGFSTATRGVVTLEDGSRCFVKIGVNDETRAWADHEVRVYRWLSKVGYPHIPALLSFTKGGFAIEDLSYCSFENTWDDPKLDAVLAAMDELASLPHRLAVDPADADIKRSTIPNGWQLLCDDPASLERAQVKLASHDIHIDAALAKECAKRTAYFATEGDDLVHDDIRADNIGYDIKTGAVHIVDWNWCAVGSRKVDRVAFLVSVEKSGYDVLAKHANRVSPEAALFVAGFWFYYAVQPIWEGGDPGLRELQIKSGIIAHSWSMR